MGGRGSKGRSLGKGRGGKVNIQSELDVWSYRHNPNNAPFVDAINSGVETIQNDFPGIMDDVNYVNAATLGGADKEGVLGYYSRDSKSVSINDNYTDINKMNAVYDEAVKDNYHPGRGNKTGTEAVALHEMGHALTDHVAGKMGAADLDSAAKSIVDRAYANSNGSGGTKAWAGGISKYAQESNAECVAEAVADWYCNGNRASTQSKAIMNVLNGYK